MFEEVIGEQESMKTLEESGRRLKGEESLTVALIACDCLLLPVFSLTGRAQYQSVLYPTAQLASTLE
jgi:hypothetical protein